MTTKEKTSDPDTLALVGIVTQLIPCATSAIGVVEKFRQFPSQRPAKLHRLRGQFVEGLVDVRSALRSLSYMLAPLVENMPSDAYGVSAPLADVRLYRHERRRLAHAVVKLAATLDQMQDAMHGLPTVDEMFFRASKEMHAQVSNIEKALPRPNKARTGVKHPVLEVLEQSAIYLGECEEQLAVPFEELTNAAEETNIAEQVSADLDSVLSG